MKNYSIWKDINLNKYPSLDKDETCDLLIIGGGITGVNILNRFRDSNLKVILAEQNKIAMSVTSGSTGKLCYLQNDLIDKIRSNFDDDIASLYIKSQREAIKMVLKNIEDNNINCDLERVDSYTYTNKDSEISKLRDLKSFLEKCGLNVYEGDIDICESKYNIYVKDTYIFNPVKYVYGLIDNLSNIYENTSIKKIEKDGKYYKCFTDNHIIKAKKVVIASHYPFFNLPFLFPIKCSLEKSYLSASKYEGNSLSLISYSTPFISARTYKDYLVYLSNSHSINTDTVDKDNFDELIKKLNDLNLKPLYLWSNIDIMTNDGLPYIGRLKDNMYIATGYNTWGLATSCLSADIIYDVVMDNDNEYIKLFDPNRCNISKSLMVFDDIYKNISGYIKGCLDNNDKIKYSKFNGKKVMEYKNSRVYRRCPHLGCELIFNEVEETFDCPCHGSRFDKNGRCISSPSNRDISVDD